MTNSRSFIFLCVILTSVQSVIGMSHCKEPFDYCQLLEKDPVISSMPMEAYLQQHGRRADFMNPVFLIDLQSGIKAVFKPCDAENLLDAYAEVAAYKACTYLGLNFVPPTILREIDSRFGSLQLFINTNCDALNATDYQWALDHANPDDLANLRIFYFVFGQWDTGPHNLLINRDGDTAQLFAIDNSGMANQQYVHYGQLPFVQVWYSNSLQTDDWKKPFPFDHACTIEKPTAATIDILLGKEAPGQLCQNLSNHLHLRYVIYRNALWVQFHAGDASFIRSWTSHYPANTIERLKILTAKKLSEILQYKGISLLAPKLIADILERRDQLLACALDNLPSS